MCEKNRPITVCIGCLVAYTDHESGECDDCLASTFREVDLIRARELLNKNKCEKKEKTQ